MIFCLGLFLLLLGYLLYIQFSPGMGNIWYRNGEYFSHPIPPGKLQLFAETKNTFLNFGLLSSSREKSEITLDTHFGKIYFVKVEVGKLAGPRLTPIESEEGERLIKDTQKM